MLVLVASFIGVSDSGCIIANISDSNVSLKVGDSGYVYNVSNSLGQGALFADQWSVGIRDSNTSSYDVINNTCYAGMYHGYGESHSLYSVGDFTSNATSATSAQKCGTSNLIIIHEFQRSKSSQIMKANVTFFNNGTSTLPVVQYRRYTNYDVGDCNVANCSNNFLTFKGENRSSRLVLYYLDVSDCSIDIEDSCNNIAPTTNFTNDYHATYEFRFGPIAAGQSVSFNVFYGVSPGESTAFNEMCTDDIEVGALWKPATSFSGLPYTWLVGYSGVGGDEKTFCPPSSGKGGRGISCFSSMNTVEEKNQGIISIAKLKIGDNVKTGTGHYTQVYGFGHMDHNREESFIQIHLDSSDDSSDDVPTTIEISSKHLIFVDRSDRPYAIEAAGVVVGDFLSGRKVVNVVTGVVRQGVYAPLTMSGDIAVSGVRASNYVDLLEYGGWYNRHVIGHAAFGPRRLFCRYFMNICMQETYTNGYGSYTRFILWCASMVNGLGWIATRAVGAWWAFAVNISIGWVGILLPVVVCIVLRNMTHRTL